MTTDGVLSKAEFAVKKITLLADDYIPSPYNLQSVIVRINLLLGDPLGDNVIADDTLRGAAAMQNAANEQLTQLLDQYIHQNISRRELSIEEMSQVLGQGRPVADGAQVGAQCQVAGRLDAAQNSLFLHLIFHYKTPQTQRRSAQRTQSDNLTNTLYHSVMESAIRSWRKETPSAPPRRVSTK